MTRHNEDRCLFDDCEQSPEEIVESIIKDLEQDFGEINWRKAKSILHFINEAIDNGEDQDEIYENALHQLEELEIN